MSFTTDNSDQVRGSMSTRKRRYTQSLLILIPLMVWLVQDTWFPIGNRIILTGLLVLGLIRWTAALVLLLIQFHLYLDTPTVPPRDEHEVGIVLLTLVSLMVVSRLRSTQELSGIDSATRLIRSAVSSAESVSTDRKADEAGSMTEVLWLAARSVIHIAIAGMLLQSVPRHEDAVREYGLTAYGLQTIQIGLLLTCAWMIVALPARELYWKRMTATQAGIWLRSQTVKWLHRDLRAIERRRRRLRSRQQRRQFHEVPSISPDVSQKVE